MTSILTEIAAYKRDLVAQRKRNISEQILLRQAQERTPLDFAGTLAGCISRQRTAIIAEVKKASPSKGVIRPDFNPVAIARAYEAAGACCLSVLTDEKYFQGMDAYLTDIRQATGLPILRKDFMLDPYQVVEARGIGADAILIIMAMVDDALAADLCAAAIELGLSVLPEVHNQAELERALALDTQLIGINNRDLHSFETRLETTLALLPHVPTDRTVITESGMRTPTDIRRMQTAGIYGFLIGESLIRLSDPGQALASLLEQEVAVRAE